MSKYINKTEELLNKIKKIADKDKVQLKPLIIQLADHLAQGIDEKRPEIVSKIRGLYAREGKSMPEISRRMVSVLLNKLKKEYFPSVSQQWIIMCLIDDYKIEYKEREKKEKYVHSSDISDANLYAIQNDIKDRLIGFKPKIPSKDIKIKDRRKDMEHSDWTCPVAGELARLAIECEKKHESEHEHKKCIEASLAVRMARDKRFTTTYSKYQAIVVGSEITRSLNNMTEDVYDELNRWQVEENERKCTECLGVDDCAATKCNHHCHNFKKYLTTKGIKWVLNHSDPLAKLQKQMRNLIDDSDEMCDMMKIIFLNADMDVKMTKAQKKQTMATHIKKDDCDKCLYYTTYINKTFFNT